MANVFLKSIFSLKKITQTILSLLKGKWNFLNYQESVTR